LRVPAIIPSAGAGVRMGGPVAKQFMDLLGRPLLVETLERFQESSVIESIVLVVPHDQVDYCKSKIVDAFNIDKVNQVVAGGKRRRDSVRIGLETLEHTHEIVLIHDGVRPFVDEELIERCVREASKYPAVISAIPAKDTIKRWIKMAW